MAEAVGMGDVLRMTDVAEILGVSVQRVQQLNKAGRLPEPAKRDQVGPLWRKKDIERWARAEWWGQSRAPWRDRK
jgi:predicted DNA-binding transcriptional regulator AlpA